MGHPRQEGRRTGGKKITEKKVRRHLCGEGREAPLFTVCV